MALGVVAFILAACDPKAGTVESQTEPSTEPLSVVTPAASCESLLNTDLAAIGGAGSRVTSAQLTENRGQPLCEVEGNLEPAIGFKVLLPTETWTQRYLQTGCGGLCGSLNIRVDAADGCAPVANNEFVLASTDMGHRGKGAEFGGDPQKRIDFAYRGVHLTAVAAKALIQAFYGEAPAYSYFTGCSDGGREALAEAQRYPEDFDGIVAGAPAMNFSVQNSFFHAWMARSNTDANGDAILHAEQLPLLAEAVLAACDGLDGLEDGLITDPRQCDFDPAVLLCAEGETGSCLSADEVEVAEKFYAGPRDPESGLPLALGGPQPGSELAWTGVYVPGPGSERIFSRTIAEDAIGGLIYPQNPQAPYSLDEFEFSVETFNRIRPLNGLYSSTDTNLRAFKARGGKLLLWHGWSDPHISPINSIAYFEGVEQFLGKAATVDFMKLYLLPGMYHCGEGTGPDSFDMLSALMAWVEQGVEPYAIETRQQRTAVAPSGGEGAVVDSVPALERSRPVYPYPLVAAYSGSGPLDQASSYVAAEGKRGPAAYNWAGEDFFAPNILLDCQAQGASLSCQSK